MLSLMRRKAGSWMIKILLGAIVVVFVFWGVGSYRSQKANRAASVDGAVITVEDYKTSYNSVLEQLRQRFGRLTDDMIKMFQVKKQALDRLVNQKILLKEAERLKFRVTDSELVGTIRKIGAFQTAGMFDGRMYKNVLGRNRLTPEAFEVIQRESMLIEKLRSFITSNVKVSDPEAKEWFIWENTSVDIDFVLFEPGSYKDIEASAEDIKAHFDDNKASYKTEPEMKVNYLHFKPETYASKVNLSDEEIKDYYGENKEEFRKQKTVEARHILLKTDPDASPETVENLRKKMLEVRKLAKDGKDFAELAKQYSEGPSKDEGGHLGEFKREAMVKPFADKAFSMKAGEISEPVKTRFGWHIIKVEKVNEESTLSFQEAEKKIRKKLTDEMTAILAYDEAETIYDETFEEDDLIKIAEARHLGILTTDFFTRKGPDKGIKNRTKFASAAFDLSVKEISEVQDLGDGYYIIQPIEKIPEKIPERKDVEEKVKEDVKKKKQDEKASKDANEFLSALKNGSDMAKESKKYGVTSKTTGFFKRNDTIPNIGYEPGIVAAAFELLKEKELTDTAIEGTKGYYVIKFREKKTPDPEGFEKEKEKIKESLVMQKNLRTFEAMLSQIKDRSEILIEDRFKE